MSETNEQEPTDTAGKPDPGAAPVQAADDNAALAPETLEPTAATPNGEAGDQAAARIGLNKVVSFHYRLAEVDSAGNRGEWLEQSHGGQPLLYLHGFHNVVVGLEKALEGKTVGTSIEITLEPEEAYGPRAAEAVRRIPIKHIRYLRGGKVPKPGMLAVVQTSQGQRNVVILKAGKFNADVDFNHPLAGRRLHYEVEVVDIRDASAEEIQHGHAHGPGGHQHRG